MSSKTIHYCDFCGAETDFDKMTSINGEIWFNLRSRRGDIRKSIVDCSGEQIDICSICCERARAHLQPFINFITSKGDVAEDVDVVDSESSCERVNSND